MTARVCAVLVVATACYVPTVLVRDIHIDGYDLVVERCPVLENNDRLPVEFWCTTRREPLPFGHVLPPGWSHDRDRENAYVRIGAARDELHACNQRTALRGVVHVEPSIDRAGRVTGVASEPADADLARCVADAFDSVAFPASLAPRVAFAYRLREPAPPPVDTTTPSGVP